jgi:hypothetical protein
MLCHAVWYKLIDVSGALLIVLIMDAVSTYETSISFYRTAWRNIPKESSQTTGKILILYILIVTLSV